MFVRHPILITLATIAATLLAGSASAQLVMEHDIKKMRSFHGAFKPIRRSFQSDAEARQVFRSVLRAADLLGLESRIVLRASGDVANAVAFVEDTPEGLKRYIFYNALFMQQLRQKTAEYWNLIAVLAHELGHHVELHTVAKGRNHKFELQADFQAGYILRRMGASLDQAIALFQTLPEKGSATHPGRSDRVQMATLGWVEAGQTPFPKKEEKIAKAASVGRPSKPNCNGEPIRTGAGKTVCIKPGSGKSFKDCDVCPEMVVVPRDSFMMGSNNGNGDERPVRKVTIGAPLAVGKFEVTFNEWDACVADRACDGSGPVRAGGDNRWGRGRRPIIEVSWFDAKSYADWLVQKTRKRYRLLTEAEWEYSARAGSTTEYNWGDKFRNNMASIGNRTQEVGQFPPNLFGLYDMLGNVWEWTSDCYAKSYAHAPVDGSAVQSSSCARRVARGGSWEDKPHNVRLANRNGLLPISRFDGIGFRVARDLTP